MRTGRGDLWPADYRASGTGALFAIKTVARTVRAVPEAMLGSEAARNWPETESWRAAGLRRRRNETFFYSRSISSANVTVILCSSEAAADDFARSAARYPELCD